MAKENTVLNDVVSKVKVIARNFLRSKLVAAAQSVIYGREKDIKCVDETIAREEKFISIAKFKLSRIENEDPEKEDKTKRYNDQVAAAEEAIKHLKEDKVRYEKSLKEENAHIADIETGKVLVNSEELAEAVDKLLLENARQEVRTL